MKKVIALILVGALCGGATIFLPRILQDYKKSIPAKKSVYIPLKATYSQMLDSIATAVDDMKSFKNVARRNELEKNFKPEMRDKIKVFNFLGKMVIDELSIVHRTALKTLKKIMSSKENPSEMEKLLVELCDADGDFSDRNQIKELIEYAKE